jgi:hypothetical protein
MGLIVEFEILGIVEAPVLPYSKLLLYKMWKQFETMCDRRLGRGLLYWTRVISNINYKSGEMEDKVLLMYL